MGFFIFIGGCATTQHGSPYTDAEVEMAINRTESETLARLAASNNDEIADAASALARERARK